MTNNTLYTYLFLAGCGKERAIKGEDIASNLHCSTRDVRKMREEHNLCRDNYVKILTCNKGYYLPASPEESEKEIKKTAFTQIKKGVSQIIEGKELLRVAGLSGQCKIDLETGVVSTIEVQE